MRTKKLLLITAVAVMLVGATNAYGYYEAWDGWFNSGQLRLDDTYTFDYVSGQGTLEDTTAGSFDSFTVYAIPVLTFTCSGVGTITLWAHTASGRKPTGQSGQKEVNRGATWLGFARLYDDNFDPVLTFTSVIGTWNTTVVEGDCFNYGGRPHIYSAHWVVGRSTPDGLTGDGGSAGDEQPVE